MCLILVYQAKLETLTDLTLYTQQPLTRCSMPPLPHSNIQKVNQAQLRYPNPLMKCNYWLQRRNRVSRLLSCLREKGFGELISDFGHTRSSSPRVSSLGQRPFAVQHYRHIPKAYETKLILAEKKDFTVNAYGGLSDFENSMPALQVCSKILKACTIPPITNRQTGVVSRLAMKGLRLASMKSR